MTTPAERREFSARKDLYIEAMAVGMGAAGIPSEWEFLLAIKAYAALLAHLDQHEDPNERALGQALRYGMRRKSAHRLLCDVAEGKPCDCAGGVDLYVINTPQEEEK